MKVEKSLSWGRCATFGSVALSCVLGLSQSAKAAVNLLGNPSFEANVSGSPDASGGDVPTNGAGPWLGYNNWVAPFNGYYTAATAHTGTQAAKTFSGPNGGIYQSVAVTAGTTYTASAYFENFAGDALSATGDQTDDVRLTFFDASNNNLGVFVSPTVVSGTSPSNVWTQLSVTAVAPAGATSVQFMGFLNNPNGHGGSLFIDDASLTAASTPEPALLGGIGLAGLAALSRRRTNR